MASLNDSELVTLEVRLFSDERSMLLPLLLLLLQHLSFAEQTTSSKHVLMHQRHIQLKRLVSLKQELSTFPLSLSLSLSLSLPLTSVARFGENSPLKAQFLKSWANFEGLFTIW